MSDSEYSEEEIEPKLKYVRLSNDLKVILNTTSATCIAVHTKVLFLHIQSCEYKSLIDDFLLQFICLGTHRGVIYILDHEGNSDLSQKLKAHSVSVNQISIDKSGEYIATCSDDGRVFIHGLFSHENNFSLNVARLVKTVAVDPNFCKSPSNKRFIMGKSSIN